MTNAKLKNNEDSLEIDEITNKMKKKEFKAILMKQSVCQQKYKNFNIN